MTSQEATIYINYGIKEGIYNSEDFNAMTEEQLIEFAEKEEARADYYTELQKEERS